jgi:deoxycytidylate deaminase
MYMTCGVSCSDCARAIINSGIKTIYCNTIDSKSTNIELWNDAKRSLVMFEECGIEVIYY